ncbi:MAG: transposase [Opitutales bacterium]
MTSTARLNISAATTDRSSSKRTSAAGWLRTRSRPCTSLREVRGKTAGGATSPPGYVESFNARFREECLEREQFYTLTEARVVLEDWRWKYNNLRPHRSLGYITPLNFAQKEIQQPTQCLDSGRPTASLRPGIDLLYRIEDIIKPSRLTKALAQFG